MHSTCADYPQFLLSFWYFKSTLGMERPIKLARKLICSATARFDLAERKSIFGEVFGVSDVFMKKVPVLLTEHYATKA